MFDLIVKLLLTRLPFVAVFAIAVIHVTYKTSAGNAVAAERAASVRHEMILQYGLVGEEVVFFDQCQPFIEKQVVRALQTAKFCGCVAKRGTSEFFPEDKVLAIKFLKPLILRQPFNGSQANALVPEAATRGSRINAARDVLAGINSCQDAK